MAEQMKPKKDKKRLGFQGTRVLSTHPTPGLPLSPDIHPAHSYDRADDGTKGLKRLVMREMYTWTRCFSSPGLISDGWLGRQDQLSSSSLTLNHQIELLWRIIVKIFILQPALAHSTYGLPPYLSWQMRPIVWSVFHPA